ncbi:unnamed protein product, partial [Amoebophrya sp. A120]
GSIAAWHAVHDLRRNNKGRSAPAFKWLRESMRRSSYSDFLTAVDRPEWTAPRISYTIEEQRSGEPQPPSAPHEIDDNSLSDTNYIATLYVLPRFQLGASGLHDDTAARPDAAERDQ